MAKKVVIIGGVAAGMKTASRLRRRDKDAEITVVERGQQVSYGACGFPYYIGGDVKDFSSFKIKFSCPERANDLVCCNFI